MRVWVRRLREKTCDDCSVYIYYSVITVNPASFRTRDKPSYGDNVKLVYVHYILAFSHFLGPYLGAVDPDPILIQIRNTAFLNPYPGLVDPDPILIQIRNTPFSRFFTIVNNRILNSLHNNNDK